MKSKKTTYSMVSFLLILIVSFVLSGCDTSRVAPDIGRPNPPAPPAVPLVFTGVVVDDPSGATIAGATVLIQGTSLSATTNGSGVFTFSDLSNISGNITVLVSASNYGYGTGAATIDKVNNQATSLVIFLKKIVTGTPVSVTAASGGTASTSSSEAAGSNVVNIVIPPGVVSQTTQVSIASLPSDATPPTTNFSTTNDISSVVIYPVDVVFNSPGATITFSLPYQVPAGTVLPVYKIVNGAYQATSINATADASGLAATANVMSGGYYTIEDQVGVTSASSSSVHANSNILSKNTANELSFSSSGSSQTIYLPTSVTNSIVSVTPSGFVYNINWFYNMLHKLQILRSTLSTTLGTHSGSDPVTLDFPALPSNFINNGVEVNPKFLNQSGTWYYYWYYIQQNPSITINVKKASIFTIVYLSIKTSYVIENGTNKTGWWWVAHNQGGIGTYYSL
jgi:hypothetical protein